MRAGDGDHRQVGAVGGVVEGVGEGVVVLGVEGVAGLGAFEGEEPDPCVVGDPQHAQRP